MHVADEACFSGEYERLAQGSAHRWGGVAQSDKQHRNRSKSKPTAHSSADTIQVHLASSSAAAKPIGAQAHLRRTVARAVEVGDAAQAGLLLEPALQFALAQYPISEISELWIWRSDLHCWLVSAALWGFLDFTFWRGRGLAHERDVEE
ncbi:hypothetical protein SVAN01_08689 [Stagonosporopsis vannaccii]|nr:hypothetical protein SVAN01_08689 [Stagonosporopsis vannaccii]